MKLTKKRVNEILKVLGFQSAKQHDSLSNEVYHFEMGCVQISISVAGAKGNIRVDIRLLGTGSWDKQYYFTKDKSMFWTEENEYEKVYDEDGNYEDDKLINTNFTYYTESDLKLAGFYYVNENELHVLENWVNGVFNFKYRDFLNVKRCIDRQKWQFEDLGKYYTLKEKGIIL